MPSQTSRNTHSDVRIVQVENPHRVDLSTSIGQIHPQSSHVSAKTNSCDIHDAFERGVVGLRVDCEDVAGRRTYDICKLEGIAGLVHT